MHPQLIAADFSHEKGPRIKFDASILCNESGMATKLMGRTQHVALRKANTKVRHKVLGRTCGLDPDQNMRPTWIDQRGRNQRSVCSVVDSNEFSSHGFDDRSERLSTRVC